GPAPEPPRRAAPRGPLLHPPSRPPVGARGERILLWLFQPGAVAAFALLRRTLSVPLGAVAELRARESDLRRRRAGGGAAARPRLDPGLSARDLAGARPRGAARRPGRPLLARAVSGAVGLRHPAVAPGAPRGHARERRHRLPSAELRAELPRLRRALHRR